jgi:NAD(P)-dependent dehydrogenase (short-subunit alcohol dehydrogenase family)
MKSLQGKVTLVAGASRGAGRGIALSLGAAGATVYVAGRTSRSGPKPRDGAPGTVEDTADEVSARGGRGIPVRVDCTVEDSVAALFERIRRENGKLDLLANAVWGAADCYTSMEEWQTSWNLPFWEQPPTLWQHMITEGPYAYFLMSCYAARLMSAAGKGLVVGVTDGVIEGQASEDYQGQLIWDLAHQCINRIMHGMSVEAKPHGIAVVTLMPGFMQTERVMMNLKTEELRKMFKFEKSESAEYVGRAVAALAGDPDVLAKSGKIHFVADLAKEYGFTDVDGRFIPRFNPFQ